MTIPPAFEYNANTNYQIGGVYSETHQFSLVNQNITIKPKGSFQAHFPNIWLDYKLPKITDPKIYDNWMSNPMQFWQNQLNFAVWCSTTGCGISKRDHLKHKDPLIRSVFRFHAYFQIRRILNELDCPLPNDTSFNALNNPINKNAYEKICSEFGISPQSDFRQRLDHSNGMGAVRYYSLHGQRGKHMARVLERAGDYDPSKGWVVFIPSSGRFGVNDQHTYKIEYIEQYFSKSKIDSRMRAIDLKVGSPFDAIGSFVLDNSDGFTQAGISRINESIRSFTWAILGAQAQTRSSVLGSGRAFDAQKQFLANVEDAINSAVDIPSSIDRYQTVLQFARSKTDFILGIGLYIIPSDLDLYIGNLNGYNNMLTIASPDKISEMHLGVNSKVNEQLILVDTPSDDFEPQTDLTLDAGDFDSETDDFDDKPVNNNDFQETISNEKKDITHDEKKLLMTLGGVIGGSVLIWYLK